jgi:hypothetical protein
MLFSSVLSLLSVLVVRSEDCPAGQKCLARPGRKEGRCGSL